MDSQQISNSKQAWQQLTPQQQQQLEKLLPLFQSADIDLKDPIGIIYLLGDKFSPDENGQFDQALEFTKLFAQRLTLDTPTTIHTLAGHKLKQIAQSQQETGEGPLAASSQRPQTLEEAAAIVKAREEYAKAIIKNGVLWRAKHALQTPTPQTALEALNQEATITAPKIDPSFPLDKKIINEAVQIAQTYVAATSGITKASSQEESLIVQAVAMDLATSVADINSEYSIAASILSHSNLEVNDLTDAKKKDLVDNIKNATDSKISPIQESLYKDLNDLNGYLQRHPEITTTLESQPQLLPTSPLLASLQTLIPNTPTDPTAPNKIVSAGYSQMMGTLHHLSSINTPTKNNVQQATGVDSNNQVFFQHLIYNYKKNGEDLIKQAESRNIPQQHPQEWQQFKQDWQSFNSNLQSANNLLQKTGLYKQFTHNQSFNQGIKIGERIAGKFGEKLRGAAINQGGKLVTKYLGQKAGEAFLKVAAEKGLATGLSAALGVSTGGISLLIQLGLEALNIARNTIDNLVRSLLGDDELYKIYKGITDWKTWGAGLTAATLGFAGVISAFTAGVIGAITFTFISPLIFATIIGLVIFFWIPTINIAPLLSTITHLDSGIGAGEQRITVPGGVCWPTDGLITQLDKIDSPGHDPQHTGASMLDIGSNNGGAVYAPFAGSYVFYPDNGSQGGNRIEGTSLDGSLAAAFLHLASATFAPASSNAFNTGDVIGYVDNSGTNTTGPHLHFEIFKGPHIYSLFPMPDKPYLNKPVSHTQCSAGSVATNTNDCSKDGPYGPNYSPANLVTVSDPGGYFADKSQLQAPAAAAVTSFLKDMNTTSNPLLKPGQRITIYHGYRSYEDQLDLCVDCAARKADSDPSNDNCLAAPAAYSNHRAGLAADLYIYDTKTKAITDLTPSLKAKAASYGLINLAGDPPHFDYKK